MAAYGTTPGFLSYLLLASIILCCYVAPTIAMRSYIQYENFFPAWDSIIKQQFIDSCAEPLNNYKNRSDPNPKLGYHVIDCVLKTMPEFRKAELASAVVILGLAPAVLQIMSASYLDTAMLAYRRPLLASLLAMSSSGVRPLTATEYDSFITTMGTDPFRTNFGKPQSVWAPAVVSMLEYTVASAAVVNNAHLSYQLSTLAVCTFAPAQDFLPTIWTAAAVLVHIVGYPAARLRISVKGKPSGGESNNQGKLLHRVWAELTPTPWQSRLEVKTNEEHTGWFLVLVSVLYIGDALQAFYGTLILSSLVFISVRDSAIIVIRLMASALFARGILIYELAGFRMERDGNHAPGKSR
ncbi:hypothetical protein FSPOR_6955 [Fusarium sporotrichioides]|uniref:Uncharacterized protein n=1 Tax=Fusarium sporotrichioides TaxID=5514 RepID=A0A395S252_FUSSP|nr:hypothetical protein FSPOR_6955 [Fusarium sporotrichioides]